MEPDSRLLDEPEPLGSVLELAAAPLLATVGSGQKKYPDSVDPSTIRFRSYRLGPDGLPTFRYRFHDMEVTDAILFHTSLVQPDDSQTIYFQAPSKTGSYPYLCTVPGHWQTMQGKMVVSQP